MPVEPLVLRHPSTSVHCILRSWMWDLSPPIYFRVERSGADARCSHCPHCPWLHNEACSSSQRLPCPGFLQWRVSVIITEKHERYNKILLHCHQISQSVWNYIPTPPWFANAIYKIPTPFPHHNFISIDDYLFFLFCLHCKFNNIIALSFLNMRVHKCVLAML